MQAIKMQNRAAFGARRATRPAASRRTTVAVRAMIPEWPDREFVAQTLQAFPDKGLATVEEARCLYENGWTYLDVRPAFELEAAGKVKNCVNISTMNLTRKYDAAKGDKVSIKEPNKEFIAQIQKKFPRKDAKLLVACSDGKTYTFDALEMLDEAGYTNLAGLRGGYYAWFRVFDNKLGRRRGDGYTEASVAEGDSCGIHGTGAGFARVDKIEAWVPPKF